MKLNKYFYTEEFDSPDKEGSGKDINYIFIGMLTNARKDYDDVFIITSGVRTVEHNKKVGGVDSSAHVNGYAADIACNNSRDRYNMAKALINAGFNRIGIAKTFIHADCDPEKPEDVIWVY